MKTVASCSIIVMMVLCLWLSPAIGQPIQPNNSNQPAPQPQVQPQPQVEPQPGPQPQPQAVQPRRVKPVRQLPYDAQMEQVRQLLTNQNYQNALGPLVSLAQQGHGEAMFFLALMHNNGDGVAQNLQEAVRWYTLSALTGWSDSMFNLGQKYYRGEGVPQDLAKAADLFFLVATTGDPDGQWAFGVLVASGEGRQQDMIEGGAWVLLAANQGHQKAQETLQTLRQQMTAEQMGDAQAAAQALGELVQNDGFALEKMPMVPVPAFMGGNEGGDELPEEEAPVARIDLKGRITPTGDMIGRATFSFDPQVYAVIKGVVQDPKYFLRELSSGRADTELAPDAQAAYDDANSCVVLDLHLLGVVRNQGRGRWEWDAEDMEFIEITTDDSGGTVVSFAYKSGPADEVKFEGRADATLPAGATDAAFDKRKNLLTYHAGLMKIRAARDSLISSSTPAIRS